MLNLFLLLIIICLNLILGFLVFFKNHHSRLNRLFGVMVFFLVCWMITNYVSDNVSNYDSALIWTKLVFITPLIFVWALVIFSIAFPKNNKISLLRHAIIGVPIVVVNILCLTHYVVQNIEITSNGVEVVFGDLGILYILAFFGYLFFALGIFIKRYRKSHSISKRQIGYLTLGLGIFILLASVTNLVIPFIWEIFGPSKYGPYFSLSFIAFTTYAIVKYRLMDIRLVITRSFIFFFLTLSVTATFVLASTFSAYLYAGAAGRAQYVIWAVAALVVVLTLDPLKRGLAQWTDSIFFKGRIDYDAILKRLTKILSEEVDARNIIIKTQSRLSEDLKINDATLLISFGDNYFLQPEEINNVPTSSSEQRKRHFYPSLVEYLTQDRGILIMDELERKISDTVDEKELLRLESVFKDARNIEAALIAPVFRENEITALLLLGHKTSGDVFNNEDINMLEVLSPQLSAALFKANLFQEAKLFNIKLKQEVEKATCQLKEANAHLQELDKAKSEFMSIASHQLRTPLSGIMGYLSMVLDGDYGKLSKEQAPIMKEVFGASQRLIRMVNLFLNVTRIEAGKLKFNFTKIEIKKTIKDLTHELKPAADKKKIKLIYKRTSEKIPEIQADADKIQDIILNLIDNAIKYTDGGRIEVSVAKHGESHIQIKVVDTGMGIDPLEAGKLFNKFVRGDGMLRINPDGAGLGLFIAKKIVEGHKGKIWAESEGLEKGSVFNVILPIKQN